LHKKRHKIANIHKYSKKEGEYVAQFLGKPAEYS